MAAVFMQANAKVIDNGAVYRPCAEQSGFLTLLFGDNFMLN
jgi:hypothetical protein